MMKYWLWWCFLCLPFFMHARVLFFKGSLEAAQYQAGKEGKLYFVDFVAGYCLPCKLMEETTFMDTELGNYVQQSYVPIKLNIDEFDAYDLKIKYKVGALPTILIFNSEGLLLDKIEGSLSATKLQAILQSYDVPQNRKKVNLPTPTYYTYEDLASENEPIQPPASPQPVLNPTPPQPKRTEIPKPVATIQKPALMPSTMAITTAPQEKPTPLPQNNAVLMEAQGDGLFEFFVKRHPSKGFAVQVGVYAEYGNVLKEVEKLQSNFPNQKVLVHISQFNGKVVYRTALGTFASREQAVAFREKMRKLSIDGVIKDLTSML